MKRQGIYTIFCEVFIISLVIALVFVGYKIFNYHSNKLDFKPTEAHYINNNIIIWGVENNFHPFIRMTSEGPTGISFEFLKLISHKTGLKLFVYKDSCQLVECLTLLKNGDISLVSSVKATPEREKDADFSVPYINVSSVIVSNTTDIKTMAVGKGFAVIPFLREKFPGVELVEVPDDERGMLLLLSGAVDAVATDEYAERSFRDRYHYSYSVTTIDFDYTLSFAIRDDNVLLKTILDRAIASITPEERNAILEKSKVQP